MIALACAWIARVKRASMQALGALAAVTLVAGSESWLQARNATYFGQVLEATAALAFGGLSQPDVLRTFTRWDLVKYETVSHAWAWTPMSIFGVVVFWLGATAVICAIRRVRVLPWLKTVSLWTGVLGVLAYGWAVFGLARQEHRASAGLARMRQHEGPYLASLVRKQWPPVEP